LFLGGIPEGSDGSLIVSPAKIVSGVLQEPGRVRLVK
jgi:hypothetical protein